jgi:hypothetical protein
MKRNTDQSEVQKELQEWSPLLARMREQETGFTVPDNYFQDLTGEILQKTIAPATKAKKQRNGRFRGFLSGLQVAWQPRYAMAMAALALLIIAGLVWLRPAADDRPIEMAWSDISVEEMTSYVQANIQEFDLETLVEMAPDMETQSILEGAEIEPDILDNYLEEIIDDVDMEELEELF